MWLQEDIYQCVSNILADVIQTVGLRHSIVLGLSTNLWLNQPLTFCYCSKLSSKAF